MPSVSLGKEDYKNSVKISLVGKKTKKSYDDYGDGDGVESS